MTFDDKLKHCTKLFSESHQILRRPTNLIEWRDEALNYAKWYLVENGSWTHMVWVVYKEFMLTGLMPGRDNEEERIYQNLIHILANAIQAELVMVIGDARMRTVKTAPGAPLPHFTPGTIQGDPTCEELLVQEWKGPHTPPNARLVPYHREAGKIVLHTMVDFNSREDHWQFDSIPDWWEVKKQ